MLSWRESRWLSSERWLDRQPDRPSVTRCLVIMCACVRWRHSYIKIHLVASDRIRGGYTSPRLRWWRQLVGYTYVSAHWRFSGGRKYCSRLAVSSEWAQTCSGAGDKISQLGEGCESRISRGKKRLTARKYSWRKAIVGWEKPVVSWENIAN